jgi:hypothetical protein
MQALLTIEHDADQQFARLRLRRRGLIQPLLAATGSLYSVTHTISSLRVTASGASTKVRNG